jgi:hypothetical protein
VLSTHRIYENGPYRRHVTDVVWRVAASPETHLDHLPESLLTEVIACLTGVFSDELLERPCEKATEVIESVSSDEALTG